MKSTARKPNRDRNLGLDLLRMVSMLMIAVLHVLGQGAVMVRVSGNAATYYVCYFLETACLCAVNCYGLLSGYVGLEGSFKPRRLLRMLLTVEFYTLLIALVLGILHPGWITRDVLLKVLLPVQWKAYWYYSAYVALFFLAPFLNRAVLALKEREQASLLGVLFMVFCVFTLFAKTFASDFLELVGGYSLLWLLILYVMGAALRGIERSRAAREREGDEAEAAPEKPFWLRLIDALLDMKGPALAGIWLLCTCIAWLWKLLVDSKVIPAPADTTLARMFLTYTSPTMVIGAVCLLLLFRQLRVRGERMRRLVGLFAPAAFYVYIIHTHPLIWEHILKGAFSRWRTLPPAVVLLPVLGTALGIYLVCSLCEIGRSALTGRLFKKRENTK